MKKPFKFKEGDSNIIRLFRYAKHKFPKMRNRLEYDEWGLFVFVKKANHIHYFYYLKNNGDLWFSAYKNTVLKINRKIVGDFKHRVYTPEKMTALLDKLLKPLSR